MGKTIIVCLIICWIFTKTSYAQSGGSTNSHPLLKELQQNDSPGQVEIIQDKRIDSLLLKYLIINQKNKTMPGFRIRIFARNNIDNGRQGATDAEAKFIDKFSGLGEEVYLIQESPDWKVYIGNFRTRTDAYRIVQQIKSVFPNNRIVECQIDFTKL